jgi:hypothetical protein
MKAEFARLGTDRGGQIEIVLRPDQYKRPGEKSVTITVPTGAEFKYDHPKDVSEFLKLSLAEILGIVDNLIDDARERARKEGANRARKVSNTSGPLDEGTYRKLRYLEID